MAIWLFEDEEFRNWLERRGPYGAEHLLDHAEMERCISCGTDLLEAGYRHGPVCGYCLAYQFGIDSQERMLTEAVADLVRTVTRSDLDNNQRLFRQMLSDLRASLAGIT